MRPPQPVGDLRASLQVTEKPAWFRCRFNLAEAAKSKVITSETCSRSNLIKFAPTLHGMESLASFVHRFSASRSVARFTGGFPDRH